MTVLKNYLKPLTDKNAQLVTRYIKNWADSAKFQVCSSHLTLCGLTVIRSEMPNFSYTHPLCPSADHPLKMTGYSCCPILNPGYLRG